MDTNLDQLLTEAVSRLENIIEFNLYLSFSINLLTNTPTNICLVHKNVKVKHQ